MVATSAIVSAAVEIQERLSRGEDINWAAVLTRAIGGGLKGGLLVISGVNTAALMGGYTGIAGVENIVSAALRGEELNAGLIGREIGNAVIEGTSAGTVNWLAGKLTGKVAGKLAENNLPKFAGKKLPQLAMGSGGTELTDAELAKVFGGAKNPSWKPPIEAPKPVGTGTKGSNFKPNFDSENKLPYNARNMESLLNK